MRNVDIHDVKPLVNSPFDVGWHRIRLNSAKGQSETSKTDHDIKCLAEKSYHE